MNDTAQQPDDFANTFEAAFARLQVAVEEAYLSQAAWPEQVAAAIRAGFQFAASDPSAADLLTNEPLAHGSDGFARYQRLVDYCAGLLAPGRDQLPAGMLLPETLERSLAGGVVTLVAHRVDRGLGNELPGLAPEAIQFALTPYLGIEEASRIASSHVD